MRAALQGAIPEADVGGRFAIQYAKEVVEFLDLFGVQMRPTDEWDEARVLAHIEYMRRHDRPTHQ